MKSPVHVQVFGSTSNLGPGFDMLGLRLDLKLYVHLESQDAAGTHTFEACTGEASDLPQDADNLICRAFDAALEAFGTRLEHGSHWSVDSEIPVARGLGSSGAAVAAGLLAACQVADVDPKEHEQTLLRLGTAMEGHPDNVVASLLGGCTLAIQMAERMHVMHAPLHADLGIAIAWGASPMPTPLARKLLPSDIGFERAADQPRRTVALLEGLRLGAADLLRHAQTEYLHVHARMPKIPGASEALQAANDAGAYLATISGSGSCLVAIGPKRAAQEISQAMGSVLERHDGPARWRACLAR